MLRSKLFAFLAIAIVIGGASLSTYSQKTPDTNKGGRYVVVDGERVFVPEFYLDDTNPLRFPEKVAGDILRGRKVIKAGKANRTFTTSRKGTEMAVDMIEFEPGEPQTRPEQIVYILERVKIFNEMIRESGQPANDSVAGAGTALLIALRVLGKSDALAEAQRRQEVIQRQIFLDEAYQGRTDAEKQSTYEWIGFFAIEALNEVKRSKSARTEAARVAAQKKSRYYAENLLSFINTGKVLPVP